jgi:AraC-like DNA-binding protein
MLLQSKEDPMHGTPPQSDRSLNARDTRETVLRAADCPLLSQYRIAHLGWIHTGAPFERVRVQPDGSYVQLCLAGEGVILLDGKWQRCLPGTVSLAPPRVYNAFEAIPRKKWQFCWVRYAEPLGVSAMVSATSPVRTQTDPVRLFSALQGLHSEHQTSGEPRLLRLWIELIQAEVQRLAMPWRQNERLGNVWRRVAENPAQGWTAPSLAKLAHCSAEHLRRLCLRELGRTPMQQVTSIRIQKAADALLTGHAKLAEIALSLGYSDAFVLSKVFKKWMGCSPSEYRERAGVDRE